MIFWWYPPPFVDLEFRIFVLSEYYSHTWNHLKYKIVWFPQFESLSVFTAKIGIWPKTSISWGVLIPCYCTRPDLYLTTCTHLRDKNMTDDLISPRWGSRITCNCTRPPVEQPDHRCRLILAPKPSSALLYNTPLSTLVCTKPSNLTLIHHCYASQYT